MRQVGWIAVLVWAALLWTSPVRATAATLDAPPDLYRIYFADWDDLTHLSGDLDIWEVNHTEHYLVAPLLADEAATLGATHRLERTASPAWPVIQPAATAADGIPGYACYRTVAETYATLDQLANAYPDLAQVVDIGDSWDKMTPGGPDGYDLRVLILTSTVYAGPKPRLFLMGGIHARELTTSETALRFAERLLTGYGTDADATWMLDYAELHVLVAANPDGRLQAEQGKLWRKNTDNADGCSADNANYNYTYGVDLNRNFAFGWASCPGCLTTDPCGCGQTYHGVSAASEPETQAIQDYLRSIYPDSRADALDSPAPDDVAGLLISLHSYAQLVLYPWGNTTTPAPNSDALAALGARFGALLGYRSCQAGGAGCLYPTDGTTDDWVYGELGVPGYTFELGTNFFQSCDSYESSVAPDTLAALDYALRVTALPYQQPQGPTITDLQPEQTTVAAGVPLTLTIRAGEPITSVRLSFAQPPWLPGVTPVAYPAATPPLTETTTATIMLDTTALPAGRTLIFAQAQDAAGVYGPAAAQFITVTPFRADSAPGYAVIHTGGSVPFTVTVTNTSAITTAYVLSTTAPYVTLGPVTPTVVAPYSVTTFTASVVSLRDTTDTLVSVALSVCMEQQPRYCLETATVEIEPPRVMRMPIIMHSATLAP